MRHAVGAPDRQPFQPREALPELEAGGAVVGVPARDAAIDQQAAQRHHEGLQLTRVTSTAWTVPRQIQAAGTHHRHRQRPGQVMADEQVDEDHADQGEDRPDREVDAAVMIADPRPSENSP